MTTYTCPDGHTSSMGDYCDVCGRPIPAGAGAAGPADAAAPGAAAPGTAAPGTAAPGAAPGSSLDLDAPVPPPLLEQSAGSPAGLPAGLPGSAPADQVCENCGAPRPPDDLFCEVCGFDFTTGQLPRPLDPPSGVPAADAPAADAPAAGDRGDAVAGPLLAPPVTPTSAPGHVEWVAEVWIDPDWYAAQDVADPCPSPGVPWVIPILERTVLVGRLSTSRNIHPQIDISTDSGVSRRHAQLSSDGQRWWVEDLQSANGTYVGSAGEALPTDPIVAGQRVELADDDRVYLGAWTRLVVRRATPEETSLGG